MKFHQDIAVFGDTSFRGDCPSEAAEQVTFVNQIRKNYPDTCGKLIVHIRNEGQRNVMQAVRQKAEGLTPGAADIIIPGNPSFVCEMKRADHTKSKWQRGQQEYLLAAKEAGCFACVALGAAGALEAFRFWYKHKRV